MSDCQDVFAYSRDPEVARHVLWDAHQSISQTRSYLRYMLRQYRNGEPSSYGHCMEGKRASHWLHRLYVAEHGKSKR